jgi:hypothetical protein
MASAKGKRLGDVFAGTMVISERAPRMSPPPPMPPQLAWWAASLQLSGLASDRAERARQFLSRAPQLDPRFRDEMAYRIATEVVAQVSPPPPPGAPPQLVLAAVLAERHRRELTRMQSAAQQFPPVGPPPPGYGPPLQQWSPPSAAPQPQPTPQPQTPGGFAPPE